MFKSIFKTQLTDIDAYPGKEELGTLRVECDGKYGERWFRYVQNATGGTLAADSLVMYDGLWLSAVTLTTNTAANRLLRASGSFITDNVKVDDIAFIIDDAGAAGAAPEGEKSFVTKVAALYCLVSPNFTAAATVNDTCSFIKRWSVLAAADKAGKRTAGIPMGALLTLCCGWVQTRGIYMTADVTAANTAIAEGDRLRAGTAILEQLATVAANANVADDINQVAVGTALQTLATDTVARKCVVMLECM